MMLGQGKAACACQKPKDALMDDGWRMHDDDKKLGGAAKADPKILGHEPEPRFTYCSVCRIAGGNAYCTMHRKGQKQ
jgi:hypothetical protein